MKGHWESKIWGAQVKLKLSQREQHGDSGREILKVVFSGKGQGSCRQ